MRMVAPDHAELLALPQAWTPGTNGPVRARVVRLNVKSKDELEKLKGKFAGKIVLYGDVREVEAHDKPRSVALRREGAGGGRDRTSCRAARRATTAPST